MEFVWRKGRAMSEEANITSELLSGKETGNFGFPFKMVLPS
jgi:hypothetical protein